MPLGRTKGAGGEATTTARIIVIATNVPTTAYYVLVLPTTTYCYYYEGGRKTTGIVVVGARRVTPQVTWLQAAAVRGSKNAACEAPKLQAAAEGRRPRGGGGGGGGLHAMERWGLQYVHWNPEHAVPPAYDVADPPMM